MQLCFHLKDMGARQLKQKLWPKDFQNLHRYGRSGDGGYVLPITSFSKSDGLISFGLNFDWSFERDFAKSHPGAPIHVYDPTVGRARFLRAGCWALLGAIYSRSEREKFRACCDYFKFFKPPVLHFRNWIGKGTEALGLVDAISKMPSAKNVLLKVDIEGSEYEILDEILDFSHRMEVIAIELHDIDQHESKITEFVDKLKNTHVVAHLHGNNFAAPCPDGEMPTAIEVVFVRRPPSPVMEYEGHLPRAALDQPNSRKAPDTIIRRD